MPLDFKNGVKMFALMNQVVNEIVDGIHNCGPRRTSTKNEFQERGSGQIQDI